MCADADVRVPGRGGNSMSEVSGICGELDPLVEAFRTRALTTDYPYIWVDARYHKVRVNGRVTSQAVVAVGVTSEGERQVLGIDVGPSEDRAFWTAFLRSLVKRGLRGVRLVTSDAQEGLKQAIATVLSGVTGSGAASISCGTSSRRCPRAPAKRSRLSSEPSSRSPITPPR
jgi:putative transposase